MNSLLALGAVVLWASLALSSTALAHLPPFYVLSWAFLLGGLPALVWGRKAWPTSRGLLLGVSGYYGYHFFLFTALRLAPPVEANLINYLWPMLMVLMTPLFFPREKLRPTNWLAAGVAFTGCVLLLQGRPAGAGKDPLLGWICALGAALTWPTYSLLKRKLPASQVHQTAGVCLVTALLCALTSLVLEPKVELTQAEWPWLMWLGIGPFGLAFYLWDVAVRRGDPRVIGALSYLTPVLSTLGLVLFTGTHPPLTTWLALGCICLGAALGAV